MSRMSVLLVDDSPLFLARTVAWLAGEPEIEVVGTATAGAQAIDLAERIKPAVVLIDVVMRGMTGIDATWQLKRLANAPAVVMLTLHGDPAYRAAAAAAGADGFVCKADLATELLPALRRACRGRADAGCPVDQEDRP